MFASSTIGQFVVTHRPFAFLDQEQANTFSRGLLKVIAGHMEGIGASNVDSALSEVQGGVNQHCGSLLRVALEGTLAGLMVAVEVNSPSETSA